MENKNNGIVAEIIMLVICIFLFKSCLGGCAEDITPTEMTFTNSYQQNGKTVTVTSKSVRSKDGTWTETTSYVDPYTGKLVQNKTTSKCDVKFGK